MPDSPGRLDTSGELKELLSRLEASNPQLYRHLALYLQVLRDGLPNQVEQACFQFATQLHPRRYAEVPRDSRLRLHQRMASLVQRCTSLLTVEQLASLATQMHEQELRLEPGERPEGDPDEAPLGSVSLGLAPPLSGKLFGWEDPEEGTPTAGMVEAELDLVLASIAEEEQELPNPSPWSEGILPRNPLTLLGWLDGMERALTRRLRNLSHALNGELMRAGMSRTLLPMNLLDAALEEQVDTVAAPPNLLRLQLPVALASATTAVDLQPTAVLLRVADLEMDQPRLRTCRRRLQQHRREVIRMAQHYQRLNRRLRANAAEQLWRQDIRSTHRPSS